MPGRLLRSGLGGHNAGFGMVGYFNYEDKGVAEYKPRRRNTSRLGGSDFVYPGVTLPNEKPENWVALSGPCITVKEPDK